MGYEDYITEVEAASYTGVSTATLNRFAEAGYFQIETDLDGLRLFSRSDLAKVFGIASKNAVKTVDLNLSTPSPNACPSPHEATSATEKQCTAPAEMAPTKEPEPQPVSPQSVNESVPAQATKADTAVTPPLTVGVAMVEPSAEIAKLQNVIALQDKLLDMREGEIRELKQERDWLRSRIEKLEDKGDRDQVLLLSEIQMTSKLLKLQAEKKSAVRVALEWLGFTSANESVDRPRIGQTLETQRTDLSTEAKQGA